jgi:hypothetical protein
VLYPILTVLAAVNLVTVLEPGRRRPWRLAVMAGALSLALVAQATSIHLLHQKKSVSWRLNETLSRFDEPIVVAGVWWAPQALFSQFFTKSMFLIDSSAQLDQLLDTLAARGHKRLVWITQTPPGMAPEGATVVEDRQLRFFSLTFLPVSLDTEPR